MNNTKLAVNQIRLNEWAETFKDRSSSGMTIEEYCQAHSLSINAYYYWLRKVRASILKAQNIEFVEIKEPTQAPLVSPESNTDKFHTEAVISIQNGDQRRYRPDVECLYQQSGQTADPPYGRDRDPNR